MFDVRILIDFLGFFFRILREMEIMSKVVIVIVKSML